MSYKPNWKLEGDYFEACNCDIVCSSSFLGSHVQDECDVVGAWHVQRGHYDNTSFDRLNVVAVFHSPGNMFSGPKWKAALYLDDRASMFKDKLELVLRIGVFGVFLGHGVFALEGKQKFVEMM
jgi:hypothetical protein